MIFDELLEYQKSLELVYKFLGRLKNFLDHAFLNSKVRKILIQ